MLLIPDAVAKTQRDIPLGFRQNFEQYIPLEIVRVSDESPYEMRETLCWLYKGNIYEVDTVNTKDEIRYIVFEEFDKERKRFEKLKKKYEEGDENEIPARQRIPEAVRIEVWRRDGGKCAICGSREKSGIRSHNSRLKRRK